MKTKTVSIVRFPGFRRDTGSQGIKDMPVRLAAAPWESEEPAGQVAVAEEPKPPLAGKFGGSAGV